MQHAELLALTETWLPINPLSLKPSVLEVKLINACDKWEVFWTPKLSFLRESDEDWKAAPFLSSFICARFKFRSLTMTVLNDQTVAHNEVKDVEGNCHGLL